MTKNKLTIAISIPFLMISFLLGTTLPAHASLLDNVVNGVKNLITPNDNGKITVDAKIKLAPDGDINKNGTIDAGDTVTFSYTINNNTDKEYSFANLKTNIPRTLITYIHNIKGAFSIEDKNGSTEIANLYIPAHQIVPISFDARIILFDDTDRTISSQPEILDRKQQLITDNKKIEIKAKAILHEEMNSIKSKNILIKTK